MTISIRRNWVLASMGVLLGLLTIMGISLVMAEWRSPPDSSKRVAALERDLEAANKKIASAESSLDSRLAKLETPLAPADRDIQELYARANYADCTFEAGTKLNDAEDVLDDSFAAYLTDNQTYAAYDSDYSAYQQHYDSYNTEIDGCWNTYLEESPLQ